MGWQPLPGTPSTPTPLADTLDKVLGRMGAPSRAGIEVVFDRWADVVGEAMATSTRPVAIEDGALVVACDEPALATHVRFLEPQLLARVDELAGSREISRIEVRVARRPGPRAPRRSPRAR